MIKYLLSSHLMDAPTSPIEANSMVPTSLGIPCWNQGACLSSGSARGTLLFPEPCEPGAPHEDAPDEDEVVRLQLADGLLEFIYKF